MKSIELSLTDVEVILEALTLAYLKTGARKFARLRDWLLNKKVESLYVKEQT